MNKSDYHKQMLKYIKSYEEYKGGDVLIRHHKNIQNKITSFNPVIAVKDGYMMRNSNYYLSKNVMASRIKSESEDFFKIYENIRKNYNGILTDKNITVIDDETLYMCNAHNDSNIGHSLSMIFTMIEKYNDKNILENVKIVIQDSTYQNIINILLIFFNENQLILLEENKSYLFKKIIIPSQTQNDMISISISKHRKIINSICESENVQKYKHKELENKKILFVKHLNNNIFGCVGYEITEEIYKYCLENDIVIIKPEDYDICELIYILSKASIIVTSPGAVSYTHMMFFNLEGDLHFIGKEYYYSNEINFKYHEYFGLETLKKIYDK
jgi:hypothetical protein